VAQAAQSKLAVCPGIEPKVERRLLLALNNELENLQNGVDELEAALREANNAPDILTRAQNTRDNVISAMDHIRAAGDALEVLVGKQDWPMPTYQDLLNGV
jgi:glutamine synthetase